MTTYQKFRPTPFDNHIPVEGRENWIVSSCTQSRDSNCVDRANFASALARLGGECDQVEVHRFGHWANGWFELILVDPTSDIHTKELFDIEKQLEQYPVLNEELLSEYEEEELNELWHDCYDWRDRVMELRRRSWTGGFSDLMAAVRGDWHAAGNILHCPSDLLY